MAAIVAEDEPPAAWDLDGAEIIFVPILPVDFVDAFAAEAGRQQVPVAGQLVFPDVFVVQGDINDVVVWWNGIRFLAVVDDGAAILPVDLEYVDKVEILINGCIVDIQDALSDLEDVAGQAAEPLDHAGGASVGWGRPETNKVEASWLSKAGSEKEFAAQSGWGVETGEEGRYKEWFQSGGF